jgi:hypothetical protein
LGPPLAAHSAGTPRACDRQPPTTILEIDVENAVRNKKKALIFIRDQSQQPQSRRKTLPPFKRCSRLSKDFAGHAERDHHAYTTGWGNFKFQTDEEPQQSRVRPPRRSSPG